MAVAEAWQVEALTGGYSAAWRLLGAATRAADAIQEAVRGWEERGPTGGRRSCHLAQRCDAKRTLRRLFPCCSVLELVPATTGLGLRPAGLP